MEGSTPSVFEYDPRLVPGQYEMIRDIESFDYSKGTHVIMHSGSVGSGKSLPAAHMAVKHCMKFDRSRILLGRKALPDIRDTIFKDIIEHLECEELKEGTDYWYWENICRVKFRNQSEIISRSWADRKYKKLGSLNISCAIIEELAENDDEDEKAFDFIKMRVGRLPHVPHKWMLCNTNPDDPSHWAYRRLIEASEKDSLIHVYYSLLKDNPFLPSGYEAGLRADMDPMLAKRMLDGEWIEISGDVVYHQYSKEHNFRAYPYEYDPRHPIRITWDFNIGEGKPMSVAIMQIIDDEVHIADQVVIKGMRTEDSLEELAGSGLLDYDTQYIINGDATGKAKDTRSKLSDWEIIEKFLSNYRQKSGAPIRFEMDIPRANPPVRERHNKMNAYFCNALGRRRMYVYKGAPMADRGFRLTKLKKNGLFIEDDSKEYQHITTAVGYALMAYITDKEQQDDTGMIPR